MRKIVHQMLMVVLLVLTMISINLTVQAEGQKKLKVGYMDYHGFVNPQMDGTYSGYCVEYLEQISQFTGYDYEYVYGEGTDLIEQLKKGEIDLLCNIQLTDERSQFLDYTSYPIGYTQGLLYTRKNEDKLCYEDYDSFQGMTVGILKDSAMRALFDDYCERNQFSCNIVEAQSEDELLLMLNQNKVDAICCEHLANHVNLLLLGKIGSDAYYITSYKDSPYTDEINQALRMIKTDVDFETTLYHKYYDDSAASSSLQFTTSEKEYIQKAETIRVGLNRDRAPFSSYDEKTRQFDGICIDVLNEIARKSGLKFEFTPQEQGVTTPELMASGKYDLICGVEKDNFISNEELTSTDAFLESAIVPVGKTGVDIRLDGELTAAVPASFQALHKRLSAEYPKMKVKYYKTNRECLDAVVKGKADIYIQNTHILSAILQEPRYEGISMLPVEIMTEHTSIAIARTEDSRLLGILNKCIQGLDDVYVSSSLISHTFASPYRYKASDFIYKFRLQILVIVILVLICFALLVRLAVIQKIGEQRLQKKNELLAQAVAQADQASTAKTQFLSRMSHEVRTPLNAIVGLTQVAGHNINDSSKIEDCLDKITKASNELLCILNDALDMSAIESNKIKISHKPFVITEVIDSINLMYQSLCRDRGIDFVTTVSLLQDNVIGDQLRLKQILLNLVSNAVKFTEKGGKINLLIEESGRKDNSIFVQFCVKDTGCGMDSEMMERLFQPFEQADASTAQKHGGSGLGLSIAKNLVELMHGAIRVESEKEKGTSFYVNLPFEIAEKTLGKVSTEGNLGSSYDFSGHTVLLADDRKLNAQIVVEILALVHLNVDCVYNGMEAVERFREKPPGTYDVIFMDVQMPVMDGNEAAASIRKLDRPDAKTIPIYAMTANSYAEDISKVLSSGMNGHLAKPIETDKLYSVIAYEINKQEGLMGGINEEGDQK